MVLEFYNGGTLLAVFEYDNYTETVNRDNMTIHCKEKLPECLYYKKGLK